jgi:hypothetical protein
VAEEPSSEPTAKNFGLREELEQNRGILRRLCGRFEQLDTEESCGVEMAVGEELRSNSLPVWNRSTAQPSADQSAKCPHFSR